MKSIKLIETFKLSNNIYTSGNKSWDVPTLIQYCKENNFPIIEIPLLSIDLNNFPFSEINSLYSFIEHSKRLKECDLNFPILLDDKGGVCDGWHRICKAIILGKQNIKAIRMLSMPIASSTNNQE